MMGEIAKLTAGSNGALDVPTMSAPSIAAVGRVGSGDHQGAGRGLDQRDHRQGAGAVNDHRRPRLYRRAISPDES
jgi:hypothetical protein